MGKKEDWRKGGETYPKPSAVSTVFFNISPPNSSPKWWKAKLYKRKTLVSPCTPFASPLIFFNKSLGAFAASTDSDIKLRFSLRFDASVQSGIWGCKSVNTNCTLPFLSSPLTGRGERKASPSIWGFGVAATSAYETSWFAIEEVEALVVLEVEEAFKCAFMYTSI